MIEILLWVGGILAAYWVFCYFDNGGSLAASRRIARQLVRDKRDGFI